MTAHPENWTEFLSAMAADGARMHRPQPRLVIGVCTRQRTMLLRRLIQSIHAQPEPAGYAVEILIVDNNDQPCVDAAADGLSGRFDVTVVHEPQIGLTYARNRALDEAAARNADWFIGVDDDEWVAADWLTQFIAAIEDLRHPVMIARCSYVYDATLSPFIVPTQLPARPRGERPAIMTSGNFAIHRCVFDAAHGPGMRFDLGYNESGGEDLEFFLRADRVHGWPPVSVPDAVAFENWNGERGTLAYRLRRTIRTQVAAYRVARHHHAQGYQGRRLGRFFATALRLNRHMIFGLFIMIGGVAMLLLRPDKGCHMIGRALERWARVVAVIPAVSGFMPTAYGPRAKAG